MKISHGAHRRISVLGSRFSFHSRAAVTTSLINMAQQKKPGYVCVSNVHTTMMALLNPEYKKIQNGSTYTVPDGVPIVWAMNLLRPGKTMKQDRIRGPSLMRDVCAMGIHENLKHYLFGGSPKALAALKLQLEKDYPGIQIVGAESPPFRPWTDQDVAGAVQRMKDAQAEIVWVGLGAPKQENWMWAARKLNPAIMVGVGAAFDLLPGLIPEAPIWLQKLGLEWLYRLSREPGRLWRRYLLNNPAFVVLFTLQWLSSLLFRRQYLCESNAGERS